jgi:hypothetical protein
MVSSLETAHRQATNSRQSLLDQGLYSEYLLLSEFCGVLNVTLVELAKILVSQQQSK